MAMDTDGPEVSVPKPTAIQFNLPGQGKEKPRPRPLNYAFPSAAIKPQKTIVEAYLENQNVLPGGHCFTSQ